MHCHYTLTGRRPAAGPRFAFEPADGPPDDPTSFDTCVSPRALRRPLWQAARRLMGLPPPGPTLDEHLEAQYHAHLAGPGPVERWVLLAFDAYHDDAGQRPRQPHRRRDRGSDIYSSNTFIRDLCRHHPDRFLFGASVHPYRPDALADLDEVFAAGACLLKLMPLHQTLAADDPRTRALLRHCRALGLPLLLHVGPEFTLTMHHPRHAEIAPFLAVLRALHRHGDLPTIIFAHVATPVLPWGPWRHYRQLVAALRDDLARARAYADLAALTAWGKLAALRPLARRQDLHHKFLFGSDFPVPPATLALGGRDAATGRRLRELPSWSQRSAVALRHAGFNDIVFQRAAELLPHVTPPAGRP